MSNNTALALMRHELRLADNPVLTEAAQRRDAVVPVVVWPLEADLSWTDGGRSRGWLRQSLGELDTELRRRGSRLILRKGPVEQAVSALMRETGASAICMGRWYDPEGQESQRLLVESLERDGVEVIVRNTGLLLEPEMVRTQGGTPYKVFTPFWRSCLELEPPEDCLAAPKSLPAPDQWPESVPLDNLELLSGDSLGADAGGWTPGEKGAHAQLDRFLAEALADYEDGRDQPGVAGTSRLSPHLHFGEMGPRQVWHAVTEWAETAAEEGAIKAAEAFLRQVYWRDFAFHMLFHQPRTIDEPLHEAFLAFPWRDDPAALQAWQEGRTGYPFIDAGMRELAATGWMHNRVRMAVASFLTKDLMLPWQEGAAWFWDRLVDADLANNTFGWQWTAGCGADASPFFRIFNPVTQGEKFDPKGTYVRQWVPELAGLPDRYIHQPWKMSRDGKPGVGAALGTNYPAPIVDHKKARLRALDAYENVKHSSPTRGKRGG